jgi:hypothetical protein
MRNLHEGLAELVSAHLARRPAMQFADTLIADCLEAAQCAWGTPDDLRQTWTAFVGICRTEPAMALPLDEVSALSRWLEKLAYPAVHHSERYRDLYRPAYRLVSSRSSIAQRLHV